MSEFLRNIRQVRIWTPRRHPRRWRSWGLWRRWLYRRRRWQPSSRLVYPASSGCSSSAATASHATAPGLGWWIASEICPPFQTWKGFSFQNWRLVFEQFQRRRIRTQCHSLQRRSWSRQWDTQSLYGIQQDRASMGASHQISSTTFSSLVVRYNAKLLLFCKPTDFTQKQKELRKTIKYSKSMK